MSCIKKYVILAFFFISQNFVSGQQHNVKIKAELDTSEILIGQQTALKWTMKVPANAIAVFPFFSDTISKGIEVIRAQTVDSVTSEDGKFQEFQQNIIISSFDSGAYKIKPMLFQVKMPEDDSFSYYFSDSLLLNVRTVEVDTTKAFKDIKPLMRAPLTFMEVLPWIIGGIVLAGLVLALIFYVRRKKPEKPEPLPYRPDIPAHKEALDKLLRIKKERIWKDGRYKEYFTEISLVIRIYLYRRFGMLTLEKTSDEIMEKVKESKINMELSNKLNSFFKLADLVKFAKYIPTGIENENSVSICIDFVEKTKQEDIINSEKNSSEISEQKLS